jgi:hypothetical protein
VEESGIGLIIRGGLCFIGEVKDCIRAINYSLSRRWEMK